MSKIIKHNTWPEEISFLLWGRAKKWDKTINGQYSERYNKSGLIIFSNRFHIINS